MTDIIEDTLIKISFTLYTNDTLNVEVTKTNYLKIIKTLDTNDISQIQIVDADERLGTTYIPRKNILYWQVWLK